MKAMERRLVYEPRASWPRLAWVARGRADDAAGAVVVTHGPGVETRADWFGEIVWDGPFEDGDFDLTEVVFGSGGRVRADAITFVASASMFDRLHLIERDGHWIVSNSLAAALTMGEDRLDPAYARYHADVDTLRRGLDGYRQRLPTRNGSVRLVYHRNLMWVDGAMALRPKPVTAPRFASYAAYRSFLDAAIGALAQNARSPARSQPFGLVSTLSNGYDSTAVTAAAAPHRLDAVLSFPEKGGGAEKLADIATRLNLEMTMRDRYAYLELPSPEPPFLASASYGYEMPFAVFRDLLAGTVMLTGYHGDTMWSSRAARKGAHEFAHGSQSGLSLTEFRLDAGFVHAPVAFLGARRVGELADVTADPEMDPWRLENDYDRPIARRIAEEAGVPRDAFGYAKMRGSSTPRFGSGLTPASAADFERWYRDELGAASGRSFAPHRLAPAIDAARRPAFWFGEAVTKTLERLPRELRSGWWYAPTHRMGRRFRSVGQEWFLFRFTASWAVDRWMRRYDEEETSAGP